MFDAVQIRDACVAWIRDFFELNGPGCNAVLGVSGGRTPPWPPPYVRKPWAGTGSSAY